MTNLETKTVLQIYESAIKNWRDCLDRGVSQEQSGRRFMSTICSQLGMNVKLDSRVVNVFINAERERAFLEYPEQGKQNKLRRNLFSIAEYLYQLKFITKRQIVSVRKYQQLTLQKRVKSFLTKLKQDASGEIDSRALWNRVVKVNWNAFLVYVSDMQINDRTIEELFAITKWERCIVKREKQSKPFAEGYQNYLFVRKNPQVVFEKGSVKPVNPKDLFANKQKAQSQLHSTEDSEEERRQINEMIKETSMLSPFTNVTNFSQRLCAIAEHNSLFLNAQFAQIVGRANQQRRRIEEFLLKNFPNIAEVQTYGSFLNGFALIIEFDIDVNLCTKSPRTDRTYKISILSEVHTAINYAFSQTQCSSRLLIIKQIPNPLIKLNFRAYNTDQSYPVKTIDLVVNSPNGIKNSLLLQQFSKNDFLMRFIVIVKLWAKKRRIIDITSPKDGFSSYGIVLMTLHYLITTRQLGFVEEHARQQFRVTQLPTKNPRHQLHKAFRGFFEYYSEENQFIKNRERVCILANCDVCRTGKLDDQDTIVNMHDFIDGTNPGKNRMRKSRSAFYFEELRRAKQLLDQGTHESIEELFKGEINPRMASINWARDNLVPYSRRF